MTPLFKKLNLKAGSGAVVVLDAPPSFEPELAALDGVPILRAPVPGLAFALAFVSTQAGLDTAAAMLTAQAGDDALLWFAYPKQSSKRYRCEFHRDRGWDALGAAGWETVRMVAIDADWSALRFRQLAHVGRLQRDPARALSPAGKARARPRPGPP